jgi:hypothetical protein
VTPLRSLVLMGVVASFGALAGCKPPPPPPPVSVFVRVVDESKLPVADAQIAANARVVAMTNPEGRAVLTVSGREGASYLVDVRCPDGYKSPEAPLEIRRLDNGATTPPEYLARCSRLRHRLVVKVKVTGVKESLPILHLGKPIARTDGEGKATVVLDGDVLDHVNLQLDTSDPTLARLHPQSPIGSFEIPNRDQETTFEVKFVAEKKAPPKVFKRPAPIPM